MPPVPHIKLGAVGSTLRDYMLARPYQHSRRKYLVNPQAEKIAEGDRKYQDQQHWDYWIQDDWQGGVGRALPEDMGYLYGQMETRVPNQMILPAAIGGDYFTNQWDGTSDWDVLSAHMYGPCYGPASINTIGTNDPSDAMHMYRNIGETAPLARKEIAINCRTVGYTENQRINSASFLLRCDTECEVRARVYSASTSNDPQTLLGTSAPVDVSPSPYPQWIELTFSGLDHNPTSDVNFVGYWISIGSTTSVEVYGTEFDDFGGIISRRIRAKNLSNAWVASDAADNNVAIRPYYFISQCPTYYISGPANQTVEPKKIVKYSDTSGDRYFCLSSIDNNSQIFKRYEHGSTGQPGNYWVRYGSNTLASDIEIWADRLLVACGSTTDMRYQNLSTVTGAGQISLSTAASLRFDMFYKYNGFLYGAMGNKVWYTTSATPEVAADWEGPIEVGPPEEPIQSIAGMGNNIYIATTSGLLYLAPGDFVVGITPWGSESFSSGLFMINHQGRIYVVANNRILQIGEDHSVLDVWIKPSQQAARLSNSAIVGLGSNNNWLIAVARCCTSGSYSVWSWQVTGWHHLMTLPVNAIYPTVPPLRSGRAAIYYDRNSENLYVGADKGLFFARLPDFAYNPLFMPENRYMPTGWIETGWFEGRIRELPKDFESVYMSTENFGANASEGVEGDAGWTGIGFIGARIYFKDDASSDWEALGNLTTDNGTIRFDDYNARPSTKRIKLGIRLQSYRIATSPQVLACVVRFLTMVMDRYGWHLAIQVAESQETLDGDLLDTYTLAQQRAHLSTLERSVPPFIFQDIDGAQYEVRVMSSHEEIDNLQYLPGAGTTRFDTVQHWTIEQVTEGEYTP